MFPFSQSVSPAVRSHLDSQIAFFNDLSKSLSGSFQSLCQANLKLSQAMLEETMSASQRMLTTRQASDVFGAVTSGGQPASETLRAYQQHISSLAAGVQVELARVTQQHGQQTARTAQALADEVTRVAAEQTDRNVRQQEETLKQFRDPFQQGGTQIADKADKAPCSDGMLGQATQSAQQSGNKNPGKPS